MAARYDLLELNTTLPLGSKSHSVFAALQCSSFSCLSSVYCSKINTDDKFRHVNSSFCSQSQLL